MKYVIYELVQSCDLTEVEWEGYHKKNIMREVLQKIDVSGVQETHLTFESALGEINDKKEKLKFLTLTIIPVINVSWDGEIY